MKVIVKLGSILLLAILIYLWNRFVVTYIVSSVTGFHRRKNVNNINRQPIKFLLENETRLVKFMRCFYWICGVLIAYGIIVED